MKNFRVAGSTFDISGEIFNRYSYCKMAHNSANTAVYINLLFSRMRGLIRWIVTPAKKSISSNKRKFLLKFNNMAVVGERVVIVKTEC